MVAPTGASPITPISNISVQGMDLETAMMAVQSQRANLLETQLKDQIEAVKNRNSDIARLNEVLAAARVLQGKFAGDAKAGDGIPEGGAAEKATLDAACGSAKVTVPYGNKGELDKTVENLKSMIDSQSNSQQMDMLRLQSLSNKRNEAFDLMTNFVKKMQDSRSSIIGNMR